VHDGFDTHCTAEEPGSTVIITNCTGGSNKSINDASPCSSANSGSGVLPPEVLTPTPCDELKKLGDPQQTNIKPNVDLLKQKVNSNDNKNEIWFETKKTHNVDDTYSYNNNNVTSPAGSHEIEITTGVSNIGGGHSHPDDTYPMFTFGDVKLLKEAYTEASTSRKSEVFYIVTCKTAAGIVNTYCIKTDNFDALNDNVNLVWDDPLYASIVDEGEKIKQIHKNQAKTFEKSNGNYEKSFLQQFANFGISMYKATDDTMTHWNKMELDANPINPVKETPCN
jgi:hypothetical protein